MEETTSPAGLSSLCVVTSKSPKKDLKGLIRFVKEYLSRYGCEFLCTEADKSISIIRLLFKTYLQKLFRQENYGLPLIV